MKYLVLETITSIANHNNNDNQPLRQNMNISKIFWKILDPTEMLDTSPQKLLPHMLGSEKELGNSTNKPIFANPMALIPYNRIEINSNMSLSQAVKTLENGVLRELGHSKESNGDVKDLDVYIVSLHSTWDIRVLLSYKAQQLNFKMPSWLQNPVIFDLCKEYERWCVQDPTKMSFFNAAALNINKRRKLHSNKIYLFTMLQLLGLTMEMYEMDEFGCIIRIFLALFWQNGAYTLEKNMSENVDKIFTEDMKEVKNCGFTKPYDLSLDYTTFRNTSSTVVYMNNLPSIVTQSELTRWFNNQDIMPLGFWTIKPAINSPLNYSTEKISFTYVPDSDTISGFAVFANHEEALKSLKMNGRSLVLKLGSLPSNNQNYYQSQQKPRFKLIDRVIEVQPSSNTVLDQVNSYLVPFPQARSKPRPGDWNCKYCGFSNFQKRSTCFRCQMSNAKQNVNEKEVKAHQKPALNPIAYPYGNNLDMDTSNTKIPFLSD
ncbi:uncharacterized protein HGUI_02714 [Hanseniaspora guilliermondii]|uniref:RanBP2-type domain-containing protein n=1 Tax=Hanseniaspora guilliermondii TaxID=56406 RepID=A0A1L0B280_9ASCO|nr:uncharacterized protein HGUI_02714 [Hanseniaspora guilliermondii]